jgi:hypothetical protein
MDPTPPATGDSDGAPAPPAPRECRMYVPEPEIWSARVKVGWEKEYCYARMPGQDYLHLLLSGEIYLQNKDEKLCLTCAFRRGIITEDRLYWQNRPRVQTISVPGLG